ncbi:MAG: hypothetical protein ACXVZX_06955 [Terriglobales bacterium]
MYRNESFLKLRSAVSLATKAAAAVALLLVLLPATAQIYENGPVNGNVNAWAINHGYVVANSFNSNSAHTIIGFEFYVWTRWDTIPLTVEWAILSTKSGNPVVNARGTAKVSDTFMFYNWYGAVRKEVVSGLDVRLNEGYETYWLVLQNATSTNPDDYLYWDENSGIGCHSWGCPSKGWLNAYGAIPSESFLIHGCRGCVCSAPEKPIEPCKPKEAASK